MSRREPSTVAASPKQPKSDACLALGDGDEPDDWTPPAVPAKSTLTICMDMRQSTGRRSVAVVVSPKEAQDSSALATPRPSRRDASRQPRVWVKRANVGIAPRSARKERTRQPSKSDDNVAAVAAAIVGALVAEPLLPPSSLASGVAPAPERSTVAWADIAHRPADLGPNVDILPVMSTAKDRTPSRGAGRHQCRADDEGDSVVDAGTCNAVGHNNGADDTGGHRHPRRDNVNKNGHGDHAPDTFIVNDATALSSSNNHVKDQSDDCDADAARGEANTASDKAAVERALATRRPRHATTSVVALSNPKMREQFVQALIAALVERPYGLTFVEVAKLAERLSGARCTGHDARLLVRDISREIVVVRRMMTPWFVPRLSVALETRFALARVIAPAVAHVLCSCSNGIDMQRLDVTVFARTGTSLRVHAANYAAGSLRGVLSFLPEVVGRIEKIAQRVVVYPTGHTRAMALFAPLDDCTPATPRETGTLVDTNDARVSRAARCDVVLVSTIKAALEACNEIVEMALNSTDDAAIAVDCRGPMGGRHVRGPPMGVFQIALLLGEPPDEVENRNARERTRGRVYQFDTVALHIEWLAKPDGGPVGGLTAFFQTLGVADLLADTRLVKVVFDSRAVTQAFWRCASCPMTRIFDMRLATLALGIGLAHPWSDNDTLAAMGTVIDADMHELDAMIDTDAWAWHRRPFAQRARSAAARQAVALAHAYQMAVAMHEQQATPSSSTAVDPDNHAPL